MSGELDKAQKDSTEAAKAFSALGASKGGKARANVLSESERKEIASKAGRARWEKAGKTPKKEKKEMETDDSGPNKIGPPVQIHGDGPDRLYSLLKGVLRIGNTDLECHVLSNHQRVLTQRELVRIISGGRESGNLERYLDRLPIIPGTGKLELGPVVSFSIPGTGVVAAGYEATALVEICDRYLQAREHGLLKKTQLGLALQAEIVLRACAKIGIIALIDEVTGFQKIRKERALQLKFQAFIAEEMQEWARMFPTEFWLELARLESIHYSPRNRPLRWGKYVMMFVYDAMDSDIGRELRKKNPNPHFLKNHHQWFKKFGRDKVHDQITKVVTIMRLCRDMTDFRAKFDHVFKRAPLQMTFDDFDWDLQA